MGPKFGISSTKVDFKEYNFVPGDSQIGYHVGLFGRLECNGFYLQPEVLYTETGGSWVSNVAGPWGPPGYAGVFRRIDIPILVWLKVFKYLRVQAGPIVSIDTGSNFEMVSGWGFPLNLESEEATFGYHAGLGLDIRKFILDAKYESVRSAMTVNTGQRINQFILSVGFNPT
jgi:hypothetical protein